MSDETKIAADYLEQGGFPKQAAQLRAIAEMLSREGRQFSASYRIDRRHEGDTTYAHWIEAKTRRDLAVGLLENLIPEGSIVVVDRREGVDLDRPGGFGELPQRVRTVTYTVDIRPLLEERP